MTFPDTNNWTREDYECLLDEAAAGKFRPEHWLLMCCNESGLKNVPPSLDRTEAAGVRDATPVVPGKTTRGLGKYAHNKDGGARGLWQVMPATLKGLGWKPGNPDYDAAGGEFRNAPTTTQIRWSRKYLDEWRKRFRFEKWERVGDLYLCNFMPAYLRVKNNPFAVVIDRLKWALGFDVNSGLDFDKNKKIEVWEMDRAARKHEGSKVYLTALASLARVRSEREVFRPVVFVQAVSVKGAQKVLQKLGLYTGAVDDKHGPITTRALRVFQNIHGLPVTGNLDHDTWTRVVTEANNLAIDLHA